MTDAVKVWRLLPRQRLAHYYWDDECVLFNDLNADTHLLGADAMTILLHLADRPADERSLQLLFGEDVGSDCQDDFVELLHQLAKLNLIEPCPS